MLISQISRNIVKFVRRVMRVSHELRADRQEFTMSDPVCARKLSDVGAEPGPLFQQRVWQPNLRSDLERRYTEIGFNLSLRYFTAPRLSIS